MGSDRKLPRSRTYRTAVAAIAACAGAPALAATANSNMAVSATVIESCSVSTAGVAFGNIDPSSGSDASGSVSVTCSNGAPISIAADAGTAAGATASTRKMGSGAGTLDYSLFTDIARTKVWGDGTGSTSTISDVGSGHVQTIPVYGRIPGSQAASPGAYADLVVVTVTY